MRFSQSLGCWLELAQFPHSLSQSKVLNFSYTHDCHGSGLLHTKDILHVINGYNVLISSLQYTHDRHGLTGLLDALGIFYMLWLQCTKALTRASC